MVTALALVARLVLAAVFAVAGATKLADREATRRAVTDFGAPERLSGLLAIVIPLTELTAAFLLVPPVTAVAGAVGALALLLLFSAAIAWNLAHGRAPECNCFGQLHSAPTGWATLARNGALAAIALLALVGSVRDPSWSAPAGLGDLGTAELAAIALGAVSIVLLVGGAFAVVSLLRSYGRVLVRLERLEAAVSQAGIELGDDDEQPEVGLEPGTAAPTFSARSPAGDAVTLDGLLAAGVPLLLVFTSEACGACRPLLPRVAEWQREHADQLTTAVVVDRVSHELATSNGDLAHVLVDGDLRVSTAFGTNGTPSAVLIAPDGTIASWVASGSEWIERLVNDALDPPPAERGLPIGADVPSLELRSLHGEAVSLESFRGRDTLLLFWNPDCGFCRSMHDDLIDWERRTANDRTPRLAVLSSGDEERTRAEGFSSTVLLDEDSRAGSAFGIDGTPMAVLLGADGLIASPVSAGADAVLALADRAG
jgi:thiol-disulfide isomerase/thioredoxin/uncharacterized membrane protein YphA (DoxX/SURF4 family)